MKPWKGIRRFFVNKVLTPHLFDPEDGSGIVLPLFLDRGKTILIMTLEEAKTIRNTLDQIIPPEDISEEKVPENNDASVEDLG